MQRCDARGIPGRPVSGVKPGSVCGWHIRGVDDVFYTHRYSMQGAKKGAAIKKPRAPSGVFGVDMNPGLERRIALRDTIEACLYEFQRRKLASRDKRRRLACGQIGQTGHLCSLRSLNSVLYSIIRKEQYE
jgi:hypothetical protein